MPKPEGKRSYEPPSLKVFGSIQMLTSGSGPQNGDGGMGMMRATMSDPRVKENIVLIGRHPLGFGLYLFDYKPGFRSGRSGQRQFGVMADEIERIVPEAVTIDRTGYRWVYYQMLGIARAD